MKNVVIHSDGGCHGNPGPGGWAAVLVCGKVRKEISGGEVMTTNNRMELRAAIEALRALKEPCEIDFHTDSQYVREGVTKWVASWKKFGWKTVKKQPVKNEDLWRDLDAQASRHHIHWIWVKGHAGNELNERCDWLAAKEIERIRASPEAAQIAERPPGKPEIVQPELWEKLRDKVQNAGD